MRVSLTSPFILAALATGLAEECTLLQVGNTENKTLKVIKGGVLKGDMVLTQDVILLSKDERFGVVMQSSDGNFVQVYKRHDGSFWGDYDCFHFNSRHGQDPPFTVKFNPVGLVIQGTNQQGWVPLHPERKDASAVPNDEFVVGNDGNLVWKYKGLVVMDTCNAKYINWNERPCCTSFKR